jgi:hypothetical protein
MTKSNSVTKQRPNLSHPASAIVQDWPNRIDEKNMLRSAASAEDYEACGNTSQTRFTVTEENAASWAEILTVPRVDR